jgi:hypothetical protein
MTLSFLARAGSRRRAPRPASAPGARVRHVPATPLRLVAALAFAFTLHGTALASPEDDIAALKQSIAAMKADYDRRIGALESELRTTRAALAQATTASAPAQAQAAAPATPEPATVAGNPAAVAPAPAPLPVPAPAPVATAADASAAAPTGPGNAGGASAFNPAVSLILSGAYIHTSQDPKNARITGFPLPPDAEIGLGTRGFSLGESELALAANIDPWLAGNINLSITGDNQISAEEAWIATTALPSGLVLKAGRFFSGVGYLNSQHSHVWDFADSPLAYQAMLGTQYSDDGVQLHWLAPTDQYLELGLEAGRGHTFPGDDGDRNAAGMTAFTLHTGGDVGDSNSWRAGVSFLQASANNQVLSDVDADGNEIGTSFTGRTRVWIADGVWKWAPNGNATRTYFKLQGEYLQSRRDGDLTVADSLGAYRVTQSGGYLQGVWQFEPRWRVGLRTELLDPGHADYGTNAALFAATGYHPTKNSLMFDFNESEFSRIRLQLAQDRSHQGFVDNQVILQYQTSLGAHGAHQY